MMEEEKCNQSVSFSADDPWCSCVFHCEKPKGHRGKHRATERDSNGKIVTLKWEDNENQPWDEN